MTTARTSVSLPVDSPEQTPPRKPEPSCMPSPYGRQSAVDGQPGSGIG